MDKTIKSYASVIKQITSAAHHYQLLGVARGATPIQLSKARRDLAAHVHPDINGAPNAHDMMALVNVAYTMLRTNPEGYRVTLSLKQCAACNGRGVIVRQKGFTATVETLCKACHGAGGI